MSTGINPNLASEKLGITANGTYTGVNKACIQSLIDFVEPEYTSVHRGYLDQMSPAARTQLLVELDALLAAVEDA